MTLKEAKELTGGLSQPSKMPCHGYSLPAAICLTGARLAEVKGSVCHGCYAMRGNYTFRNVQKTLSKRAASIAHPDWVDAMVMLIAGTSDQYFRWHDSGDLQSVEHLVNIAEIARRLPHVRFWLPTREYKIVAEYRAAANIPSNLVIRLSAHMVDQPPTKLGTQLGLNTSTVHAANAPSGIACDARSRGNQCGPCRACWDPAVANVSYPKH